jgi:hypothetical protein
MCLPKKLAGLHHIDERGLELESILSKLTLGLVRMLAAVGAENSQRLLLAMVLNSSVKLRLIRLSSDSKADTLMSLALVLLSSTSGSSTNRTLPCIRYTSRKKGKPI